MIIPVLLTSNKKYINIIANSLVFESIYLTISNLNFKTRKQCKQLNVFLLSLILINKRDNIDIKLDNYYICFKIMTKYKQ